MQYISSQRGFSLIEVLVAVLIVAIGLVGVAGMQFVGLKGNQQSFSKNQAAHHAQALLERMRSNPNAVSAGNYVFDSDTFNCDTALAENCGLDSAACSDANMASYDLFTAFCGHSGNINSGIRGSLSSSSLSITCAATCDAGVSFQLDWQEQQLGNENNASTSVPRQLLINTVIK